jgi:DNA-binding protein Fis
MTNPSQKDIIIYNSDDGKISFNVNVFDETVWLNQEQIGQLFGVGRSAITKHLKNIYLNNELTEESTCSKMEHMGKNGQKYKTTYYNLDAIISIGYRVNSIRATQFRQWATQILKQYLMTGYTINESRIRQIEFSIDTLVKDQKLLKDDVNGIKNLLLKLIEKPVVIHNHNHNHNNNNISIASNKLEEKIIELIDQLIENSKDDKLTEKLKDFESKILTSPKDQNTKNKIINFFNDLGDDDSDISKKLKAIDKSKMIISKLIELGTKLKNLL